MKLLTLTLALILGAQGAWAQTKAARHQQKSSSARAKNINMNEFDSLGSNQDIIEKAQALQPNNSMRIVQKREVDRNWRLELGPSIGMLNGGDAYVSTYSWGAQLDLHITPRWSIGARYASYKNDLTAEGRRAYDGVRANNLAVRPDISYPQDSEMAILSWYPIYGKVSWFESAVSQFDLYFLGGGGQIKTKDEFSGSSTTGGIYTVGAGMGVWWNSWFTSRLEVRYQSYKDKVYTGERNADGFIGQIGIGFML
jgi:outer membrane beta-barrel protein